MTRCGQQLAYWCRRLQGSLSPGAVGSARRPRPACPEGGSLLFLRLAALNDHERVVSVGCNHDLVVLRAQTQHLQLVLGRRTRASAVRDSQRAEAAHRCGVIGSSGQRKLFEH